MAENVIVMVLDLDDGKHGEFNVLSDGEEAARLVESLLESGFDQERIRVFYADELAMQVSHRPVVSLVGEAGVSDGAASLQDEAPEQEGELVSAAAPAVRAETQEEIPSTPFVKDGVRFSSLFRPA